MKKIIALILFVSADFISAQCPTITCASVLSLTNCASGQTIAATSNYSANITSRWIGPGNINIASVGAATSIVNVNNVGVYIVEFKDNFSNCVVYDTLNVSTSLINKPTFSLSLTSNTLCINSPVNVSFFNASASYTPGGPVSYTLLTPASSTILPVGALSNISNYTVSSCGVYEAIVKEMSNSCISSFSFVLSCSVFSPQPLSIIGTNTVCAGSSVNFTANGTNHYWNTGANTASMNTIPVTNTTYIVYGIDLNGCPSSGSVNVNVNTTCSDVWPGDANSNGIVNNLDVFEIGLAFSNTGALRSPGGNAYNSQFANNWIGTVSTGKNKCHADCNGDGLVDNADTMAIHNNYNLIHSFKTSEAFSVDPDISIQSFPSIVNVGMWNKADIVLGNSNNPLNQLYGIAFDINYDPIMIETDSVYLVYTSSFMNSSKPNVQFRKTSFSNGKIFAASVRTDGATVSGEGKIAEFWFKLKSGLSINSTLNLSVSNSSKMNNSGSISSISSGSTVLNVVSNAVGLQENYLQNKVYFFPNPASTILTLQSSLSELVSFTVFDIVGREILKGEFSNSKTIDLSAYSNGAYVIKLESEGTRIFKKIVVEK